MIAVLGAFMNPALEQSDMLRRQDFAGGRARHSLCGLRRGDAGYQGTVFALTRYDSAIAGFELNQDPVTAAEPQAGLALFLVGAVTLETVVRQDGPDITVEVDPRILRPSGGR